MKVLLQLAYQKSLYFHHGIHIVCLKIIQLIHKPKRKVLIKRGINATEYFGYCEEVGCDIWGYLSSISSISGEPICLWLPLKYQKPNTSEYVQGVELPIDFDDEVPKGFDLILLPEADYLVFQGEPFDEKDYCQAIEEVQESIKKYDPTIWGYKLDKNNPRIQL